MTENVDRTSNERLSISAEGSELMMELFNRTPVETLKSVPEPIRKRLSKFMVDNGYRFVFDRWFLQADPKEPEMPAVETSPDEGFQARVHDWMAQCFIRPDAMLPAQRSFRFIEEALELGQASGTSREDILRLVDYVYSRPVGSVDQEIGGVMVTLAGLANSVGLSVEYAGNAELARCTENTEKIRAKDLAKPQRSPLSGSSVEPSSDDARDAARYRWLRQARAVYDDTRRFPQGQALDDCCDAFISNQDGHRSDEPSSQGGFGTAAREPSSAQPTFCGRFYRGSGSGHCQLATGHEGDCGPKQVKASCTACEGKPEFPNIPCSLCGRYPDGSTQ